MPQGQTTVVATVTGSRAVRNTMKNHKKKQAPEQAEERRGKAEEEAVGSEEDKAPAWGGRES